MVNVFVLELGNTANAHKDFMRLVARDLWVNEVSSIQSCNFILAFCPIVSRVGTDIEAALPKIPDTSKPVILAVLHHTFDRDYVVPNTSRFVQRHNITTVDCIFSEDEGLFPCPRNDAAIDTVKNKFRLLQPAVPHSQSNFTWVDSLLECVIWPLGLVLACWDRLFDSPPRPRPALRVRFPNIYAPLVASLFVWAMVMISIKKIITRFV